jgi:membrane-associated protein
MDLIQDFFRTVYNVPELIRWGGLVGLILIVFAETGLMIGFFLPGDSLLVTAGLFAARGDLDILWLNLALMAAAVLGDATGYWIGKRTGEALYSRPNSFFFRRQHLIKTHEFYEKHGGKTIVIARFMPILRTFAPVVA